MVEHESDERNIDDYENESHVLALVTYVWLGKGTGERGRN